MGNNPYAQRVNFIEQSEIRRLLEYADAPGWISFGGGFPDHVTFFMRDKIEALVSLLVKSGRIDDALQYQSSQGVKYFRKALKENYFPGMGIEVGEKDAIFVGTGAQQILSGFGKMYGKGIILTETPTYVGALPAFKQGGSKTIGVKTDRDGMDPEALEEEVKRLGPENINLIYLIPNFQNPTGIQISKQKRKKLLSIAWKYEIPIIEDDPYPLMHFPDKTVPLPIKALEQEWLKKKGNEDRVPLVSYLGTSSKTFGGGFRVGWMVGPKKIIQNQAAWVGIENLHAPVLNQYILAEYINENKFDGLVKDTEAGRQRYFKKFNCMTTALKDVFGDEIEYMNPDGGLFMWVKFPGLDTKKMLDFITATIDDFEANKFDDNPEVKDRLSDVDRFKIIFVPGGAFSPGVPEDTCEYMRITYANSDFDEIKEGVQRIKNLVELYKEYASGSMSRFRVI